MDFQLNLGNELVLGQLKCFLDLLPTSLNRQPCPNLFVWNKPDWGSTHLPVLDFVHLSWIFTLSFKGIPLNSELLFMFVICLLEFSQTEDRTHVHHCTQHVSNKLKKKKSQKTYERRKYIKIIFLFNKIWL